VRKRRCEHATRARRKSALRGLVCCAGESMASRCMQRNHLQQRQSDAARLPVMLDEGEAWHGRTSRSPKGRQDFPHILRLAVSTKCRSVLPLAVGLRSSVKHTLCC
jgi:hypothetical protein